MVSTLDAMKLRQGWGALACGGTNEEKVRVGTRRREPCSVWNLCQVIERSRVDLQFRVLLFIEVKCLENDVRYVIRFVSSIDDERAR